MSFEGDYFKDIDVADSGKVERYVYLENDKEDASNRESSGGILG